MIPPLKHLTITKKEILFQVVLNILVFIFYSFDRYRPQIGIEQFSFYLNYAFGALLINYVLLSRFLYSKKLFQFFLFLFIILLGVILIEELVLEKIYYPDTKGRRFLPVYFTLIDVLPVILILTGFKLGWDAFRNQQELENLRSTVKESELQFLKSQINPHFLFNNLNNLYSYAIENSPKTPSIILELSSVLRYMLYECKAEYVPLTKELEQIQSFSKLNEMQIEERGEVNVNVDLNHSNFVIAPLIMIVFIENAFKHSQSSQSDGILIDIDINVNDQGRLEFSCKNTYKQSSNSQGMGQGIGLENVKKRLNLIYPDAHNLKISEQDDVYQVNLTIQLKKMEA